MRMLQALFEKAQRLFIELDEEFNLIYKDGAYRLKDPNHPLCHILEIALITNCKFTGNKLNDISLVLSTNTRWILGFYHGYKKEKVKYINKDYFIGHHFGTKMRSKIFESKQLINI